MLKKSGRFSGYNREAFRKDLLSGVIVGIIAIPLGMAFAIASGVKPEYGLYTTIIAGVLISLFGGSRFQIGGPTGAFIPILFVIVMQYGYEHLLLAGFMAGGLLVLMGALRLGTLVQFIPRPVITGFTAGIAVIIFSGQIPGFLGLDQLEKHETLLPNLREIALHLPEANVYSVIVAFLSLAVLIAAPRWMRKVPASLAALVVSGAAAALLFEGRVETIGSVYGAIPAALPQFRWPEFTLGSVDMMLGPALIIAMLGGIESLLSAVVADRMTGTRHDSNRELIGQGIANLAAPLFGGIPATGAIARTAANIRNGAVSPLSGVIHGITVLLVLLLFAPWASHIPLAGMAPVLMLVAWNMSERKEFWHILKAKTSDSLVLLITFLFTVFTNLTTAVQVGLVLAVLLFVKQMSSALSVLKVLPDPDGREKLRAGIVSADHDCPQFSIYSLEGPLFFGTAKRLETALGSAVGDREKAPRVLLLRMSKVPFLDMTGETHLFELVRAVRESGGTVLVSGIQEQPHRLIRRTKLYDLIGTEHFFSSSGEAIDYAMRLLDKEKCRGCLQFAFRECGTLSGTVEPKRQNAAVQPPSATRTAPLT